jgi:hypothetical protein
VAEEHRPATGQLLGREVDEGIEVRDQVLEPLDQDPVSAGSPVAAVIECPQRVAAAV